MSELRIFVTLSEAQLRPSDLGLGDALLVDANQRTWELATASDFVAEVFHLVMLKRLVSAYVSLKPIPSDKKWVAREWRGKVVVDLQLANDIGRRFGDWISQPVAEHHLVIFAPPHVETLEAVRRAYRAHLNDQAPMFVEAEIDKVLENPRDWFDEYAGPGAAGWVTLVSATMDPRSKTVLLGNLAALGFRKSDSPDSLWNSVRSGIVSARAIAFSREQEDWHEMGDFCLPRDKFALESLKSSSARYAVAVEINAAVDPKVIIGSGTVFEQFSPGHTQNLSVAQEWHDTIDAGQILGVVLPAYCLNQNMSAPSGGPVQLTPFSFTGNSSDQNAVWHDIAERTQRSGRP